MQEKWQIAEDAALDIVKIGWPGATKSKNTGAINRDMDIIAPGLMVEVKSRQVPDIYLTSNDIIETIGKADKHKRLWFFIYMNNKCELFLIIRDLDYYKINILANCDFNTYTHVKCGKTLNVKRDIINKASELKSKVSCNTKYCNFFILAERETYEFFKSLKDSEETK